MFGLTSPVAAFDALVAADVLNAAPTASSLTAQATYAGKRDNPSAERVDVVEMLGHIASVRGFLDACEAALSQRAAALVDAGELAGSVVDTHVQVGNVSAHIARQRTRRGEFCERAPAFGVALADGVISATHVDVLANIVHKLSNDMADKLLAHHADLLADAARFTPERFRKSCRDLVAYLETDEGVTTAEQQRQQTRLTMRVGDDGMHHLNGVFHPEMGTRIWSALQHATKLLATGKTPSAMFTPKHIATRSVDRSHLAAEALANLCTATPGTASMLGGRPRAEVIVHIDHETLLHGLHERSVCEYSTGVRLPPSEVRRLASEANVIPVVLGRNGVALDVGRSARLATSAQRTALRAMYPGCAIDQCDTAFDRCEVHHLIDWVNGGRTDLNNMVPLCSRHHHLAHQHEWQLTLDDDRTLTVTTKRGAASRHPLPRNPGVARGRVDTARCHHRLPTYSSTSSDSSDNDDPSSLSHQAA